jgi:glutamine---fructose-6-phosphate transaminase (isomerizing)
VNARVATAVGRLRTVNQEELMCGIVGYVGDAEAAPVLLAGLRRLEYRGYDSAGIAVLDPSGGFTVRKREGKLARLIEDLAANGGLPRGGLGIGHTRWATHGAPSLENAHPHLDASGRVVLVHNGIIENYVELRDELEAAGHVFVSQTDTEVVAHLIGHEFERRLRLEVTPAANGGQVLAARPDSVSPIAVLADSVRAALGRVHGAYALAVCSADVPDAVIAARSFSPLVLGLGPGEAYVASDIPALLGLTRTVMPLDDGHVAVLTRDGAVITDLDGRPVPTAFVEIEWDAAAAEKGGYAHFVRKEIDEQPEAIADTLRGRLDDSAVRLRELDTLRLDQVRRVYVVAAGSSYYAGLVAKHNLEAWATLPTELAIASEFRYGDPVLGPDTLVVLVTQSGETADTLAALRAARDAGAPTVAVTNVVGSSVTRGADVTLYLQVGPEIGVIATKTFTGQLAVLALLAMDIGRRRGELTAERASELTTALRQIPAAIGHALQTETMVAAIAAKMALRRSVFFIGRGVNHAVALEAALKLKEISYLHAEGYPAGELKHGPIAMLEPGWPVVAFVTPGRTRDKLLANIEEVKARGAEVVAIAAEDDLGVARIADQVIAVPTVPELLSPLVNVVPAQLLAYHVAVALGRDVDQPRNLAKSVTVE